MDYNVSFNDYINNINKPKNKQAPACNHVTLPIDYKEQNDVFVKQNQTNNTGDKNKKTSIKKFLLAGLAIIASLATILGIKNARYMSKIKKELIQAYDKIFDNMATNLQKEGIVFEKPTLKFKKLKNMLGGYMPSTNEIVIDSNCLKKGSLIRRKDTNMVSTSTLEDGKRIISTIFATPKSGIIGKDFQKLSSDEQLFNLGLTIKHELTHARQEQLMLSSENAINNLYEAYKKGKPKEFGKISFEDFKNIFPFCQKYKPSKTIAQDNKIAITIPFLKHKNGENLKFVYTPKNIIDAKANYETSGSKYYSNLLEIEARIGEEGFMHDYKKYMPNITIDNEVLDYYRKASVYQIQELITPLIKSQPLD